MCTWSRQRCIGGEEVCAKGVINTYREGGGGSEVLPLQKVGGTEKVLAMLKGGQKTF